ncbi:MAG: DNA polymerase III subunit gamma/tau [Flavobacteriales bacterium]|nr:DNA polymerase III subunit gamma/tau [Flavobacteriales bacterium]
MDRFVVSARKYRPATFDAVVGQEAVTSTLKNAIRSGHLAQAFLFTGPRGVGKTTCARILASTVNCEDLGEDLVACGTCPPCKGFKEGHSMSIFELDAASNNSVDNIRDLILQVSIAPQVGTKKVYIIDEVHMLSQAAFNAFLKTLEEPPSYAIFILATTEKHKILPTILSRCQVFDFRRISVGDIARHLAGVAKAEGVEAEPQALHTIAVKADGGLRDALSIFDQLVSATGDRLTYQDVVRNLNVLDHEHYFRITGDMISGDAAGALVEFNAILQQGFDGHLFVTGLARHLRDLLVCQDPRTLELLEVSEDLRARYAQQASQAPRALLVKGLELLAQVDAQYKSSKEPRLLVELALIQACQGPATASVEAPPAVEKKSPDGNGSGAVGAPPKPAQVPVAQEPAPVAPAYVPKRRMAGQVSIKAVPVETAQAVALEADHEGAMPTSDKAVNPALLMKVWNDYALQQKAKGRNSLHATLVAHEPQVAGPGRVSFTIVNEVQENYLRTERPDLLGYLRRAMGDPGLELEVTKVETIVKPRGTPKERFQLMAERNPAVTTLRDVLDLDLG